LKGSYPSEYGAGAVVVWDSGDYTVSEGNDPVEALDGGKIDLQLCGKILKGNFTLVKMKRKGEKNWLLIKKTDEHSQTNWTLQEAPTEEKESTLRERKARKGRNPMTGEEIKIKAKKVPKFVPGKGLKDAV